MSEDNCNNDIDLVYINAAGCCFSSQSAYRSK